MYQKIIIAGRLGRDPELRHTPSEGTPVCNFSVAVDKYVSGGEKATDWFRVIAWKKLAETCASYLTKGKAVLVEGRLQIREYEDKGGEKRTAVEIVASSVQFLSPKNDTGHAAPADTEFGDDDVPF
jgi:single-strand DNA-binding protein